ncbi:MAG: phasin family protein [Proteobacteria bacterium]|uniref:phasin family protein n=1 Tax=Rudaea sp. TaxID=2136325 RepID=UPI0032200241|nr:phasin family protein [Pseudomonadota bacterium]
MAGKPKLKSRTKAAAGDNAAANKSIMESAQQIWLAGLGAFTKAREDGTKLFENLVKEGLSLEAATRKIATGKVDEVRGAVESGVSQVRERTQETWDRLEQVFESRVSRALGKLGVPGRKDLDELLKRIDELNSQVVKLNPAAKKAGLAEALTNKVKRARDDFGDLVKDIEDAQLAAKQTVQRQVARLADAVAPVPAKPARKTAAKKAVKKAAKKVAKKK